MSPSVYTADDFFDKPVTYVKGVGPQRADILTKELDIKTYRDLLYHFPYRYIDRTKFYKVSEIHEDLPYVQLKGIIKTVTAVGKHRATRLVASFKDDTGSIDLIWFQGITWLRDYVKAGVECVVFGKPTLFQHQINIVHPELEPLATFNQGMATSLQAMYNTTEKCKAKHIDSKAILKMQKALLQTLPQHVHSNLPDYLINGLQLMPLREALINIHLPESTEKLKQAELRFKFEELFYLTLKMLKRRALRVSKRGGLVFSVVGENFTQFYNNHLPFALTEAQKRVIKEIRSDCNSGFQMNRLLQGDVGSGKTIVALMCILIALDNGYQACMMAPTEVLAEQHYATLKSLLAPTNISIALLKGATRAAERRKILEGLNSGSLHIIIGTHALLEDSVQFNNLGFVVIDEQHRFGVAQRSRLWSKRDGNPPHVLVMSATPIPRTLSMTIYGDLDVSIIDELPPGRKPIKTLHKYESHREHVWRFMKQEIAKGRQVYVVYPLIEESEQLDYQNLMQGYEAMLTYFTPPEFKISIVHGKQKSSDRDVDMQNFVVGKTNIMIATTVIEVGVNVPNASVMIIESAQRFGLSQLHQLRGRVGRGADQSYCILVTDYKLSSDAKQRLQTMVRTNDGFEIAEEDLRLRGPGDIEGTQQSGITNLKIADITKDQKILELARKAAQRILDNDPQLLKADNSCIRNYIIKQRQEKGDWGDIS